MAKILVKSKLQRLAAQKKDAYVTRVVNLPLIDADTLLERAADNSGLRRGVLYAAVDAVNNEIKNFLANGHPVEVPMLGIFRFAVNAHASETMEDAGTAQIYRRKIIYRPTVALNRYINTINLTKLQADIVDDTNADNKPTGTGDDPNNG